MNAVRKILFLCLLLGAAEISVAQKVNPEEIINRIISEYEKIEDYQVDLNVKVDISFLKMPEINAKIFFKKPDKLHVESKGFALLPKQGLHFSPLKFLEMKYTAVYESEKELDGEKHHVIKIIPEEGEKGPSLITLYVNSKNYSIRKVTSIGEKQGKVDIELMQQYIDGKYWLPKEVVLTMDVGKFNIGRRRFSDESQSKPKQEDNRPGKVFLKYSNYIVNKGIDDKIFSQDSTKSK
ncbi:MAG: hypothetical protein N3A61_00335 [Ignavibacteria bacterium]|nr:hypothetical protein [Ignavibacteria bacterium]